jgi:hypothetical protein
VLRKLWHDPVWSAVIAALIVAVLLSMGAYFLNWWPTIIGSSMAAYRFVWQSTPVWNWLLGVLGFIALLVVTRVTVAIWRRPPGWRTYREDILCDLVWRWTYDSGNRISTLHAYCRHCDLEIDPVPGPYLAGGPSLYECDGCNRTNVTFAMPIEEVHNKIRRLIAQKIRKEWRRRTPTRE